MSFLRSGKSVKWFFGITGLALIVVFQNCAGNFQANISQLASTSTNSLNTPPLPTPPDLDSKIVNCKIGDQAPALLSETCFGKAGERMLARAEFDNVIEFEPQYPLYSDGSEKRRWLILPPGTKVNTFDPDGWTFPKGSVLYKQFYLDGKLLETRQAEKVGDGDGFSNWRYTGYANLDDDSDGIKTENNFNSLTDVEMEYYAAFKFKDRYVVGTPSTCSRCHTSAADSIRGFSYLQLSSNSVRFNLDDAKRKNILSMPPLNFDQIPGNDLDKAVIGYVQSNCATCHDGRNVDGPGNFRHRSANTAIEDEGLIKKAMDTPGFIIKGNAASSNMYKRFSAGTMPANAHKTINTSMVSVVRDWINQLNFTVPASVVEPNFSSIKAKILNTRCIACHNSQPNPPAGLNFMTYEGVMADNVVVPNNLADSRIIGALERELNFMPKNGNRLTTLEIAAIKAWINSGAPNN